MCKNVNCKIKHRNANFLYSIINSCSTSYLKDINEKGCIKIVDSIVDKIYKSYPENRKEKIDFYYFIKHSLENIKRMVKPATDKRGK
jgi:hypothetical protein